MLIENRAGDEIMKFFRSEKQDKNKIFCDLTIQKILCALGVLRGEYYDC